MFRNDILVVCYLIISLKPDAPGKSPTVVARRFPFLLQWWKRALPNNCCSSLPTLNVSRSLSGVHSHLSRSSAKQQSIGEEFQAQHSPRRFRIQETPLQYRRGSQPQSGHARGTASSVDLSK